MALRNDPYAQFNYRVEWDGLDGNSVAAGFQEVSGLGMEINYAEYRAGDFKTDGPSRVTGMVKTPDVTLRRGVVRGFDLYSWLNQVRDGSQGQHKTVTITLLNEDRQDAVQWVLKRAWPMKYTGPSLNGKGTDLAIEELVLVAECLQLSEAASAGD